MYAYEGNILTFLIAQFLTNVILKDFLILKVS